nr:MAG TPA: hypothetical protein [Caudoviricetes sp.]
MMDIAITGMTTVPSDYACQDGQTALLHNLVHEYGEVRPMHKPKVVMNVPIGFRFLFVHANSGYKHYIFQAQATDENGQIKEGFYDYYYCDAADENNMVEFASMKAEVSHVDAIGNTLLIFTEGSINYYLWKNVEYKSLGDALPEIGMRFGLLGEPILYSKECSEADGMFVHFDYEVFPNSRYHTYKREDLTAYTTTMLAPVSKLINEHVTGKGKFCFPFFVRYAMRLYDGTLVHHSAPILMMPSTYQAVMPFLRQTKYNGDKLTDCRVDAFTVRAALTFLMEDNITKAFKEKWGDIVKSVDIFVSAPLYTYDAGGIVDTIKFPNIKDSDYANGDYVGRLSANALMWGLPSSVSHIDGDYTKYHSAFKMVDLFNAYCKPAFLSKYDEVYTIELPAVTDEDMRKKMTDCSSFYLLKSISLNELINASEQSEAVTIKVKDDYLQSLVNREVMTDDYLTHEKIAAERSYVYNSRLNLAGVTRQLYDGYPIRQAFCRYDGRVPVNYSGTVITFGDLPISSVAKPTAFTISVEEGGREIKLYKEGICNIYNSIYNRVPTLLFCPYTSANNAIWWSTTDGNLKPLMALEMKMHDFLNLSYASLYFDPFNLPSTSDLPQDTGNEDKKVKASSSIYTSAVNNPFYFPSIGVNDVGIGEVVGMAAAVAAMSQGQFGEFPLYAFTSNGVWALSVGKDGSYQTATPVTRDVCSNPDAIISLDRSVIFPTKRGIMMISGSQSTCITEVLHDDPASLLSHDVVKKISRVEGIEPSEIPDSGFLSYLDNAGMVYDYTRQRVIVFNHDKMYAYVLSLTSKMWSTIRSEYKYSVNSYPDGLAITQEGIEAQLVNVCEDGEAQGGVIVTRPMKLNNAHALGTITDIMVRGNLNNAHASVALLGTRDYTNYLYVGSGTRGRIARLHGSPYKAFVVVVMANLEDGETIDGMSVEYQMRQANRMR